MATIRVIAVVERVEEIDVHLGIGGDPADAQRVVDVNGPMVLDSVRGNLRAAGRLEDGDTVRIVRAAVVQLRGEPAPTPIGGQK